MVERKTRFDVNKSPHHIAEGRTADPFEIRGSTTPTFRRMVVLEVIFDPTSVTNQKLSTWVSELGVKNIELGFKLPRNSIIARSILDGNGNASEPSMFLFPFFPPHLSLPCKPGEHVWVMFENPDARYTQIGYWMSRIVEPWPVDDVNHTHAPRTLDQTLVLSVKDKFDGNTERIYEYRNGVVGVDAGERFTQPESIVLPTTEDAYEKLVTTTEAAKVMQYESIPRFKKRPGDVALEGTNNTLIVLGTDRTGPAADFDDKIEERVPKIPDNDLTTNAGSIDIVAGRGRTKETSGGEKSVVSIKNASEIHKELDKHKIIKTEGDPDLKNDKSRVLVAQRTKTDANFGLTTFNLNFQDVNDDENGDGAVVIKSDKVRLIARADVEILVSGFTKNEKGEIVDQDDETTWAAIVLRKNGDIIFRPSSKGVIKLGGDDADKALLCTDMPAKNTEGIVSAQPVFTTGNDVIATSKEGQGTFAKKILVVA